MIYPGLGDSDLSREEADEMGVYWTFEGDKARLYKNNKLWGCPFHVTIDPKSDPKQIDLMYTEGPPKGHYIRGIYEVRGDRLRLILSFRGPRPNAIVEMQPHRPGIDSQLVRVTEKK
jgi:uncharacterized protein (TIGR03067 family)